MDLNDSLLKATPVCIAMVNAPIIEGVRWGERQSGEAALTICPVAIPDEISVLAVTGIGGGVIGIEIHPPLPHQGLEAAFSGETVELVSIGEPGVSALKKILSIQPMAFHGIKIIWR
jgi:hypothetical protein